MYSLYYYLAFLLSIVLLFVYVWRRNRQFNACFTIINTVMPVANLGYLLLATSTTVEEAVVADKVIYFETCFLLPLFLLTVMVACRMDIRTWTIALMFLLSVGVYALIFGLGKDHAYYRSVRLEEYKGVTILHKTYGTNYLFFVFLLISYMIASLILLTYSLLMKKKRVSRKVLGLMFLCELVLASILGYEQFFDHKLEWIPAGYLVVQFIYILIINVIYLYDMDYMSVDSHTKNVDIGFFSVDRKMRFLGSNHIAMLYFEELRDLEIDRKVRNDTAFFSDLHGWVKEVEARQGPVTKIVSQNERIYKVTVGYLVDNYHIRGYQFIVEDDTKEQRYINIINHYNDNLQEEVDKKTKSLREAQDQLILGMADMVENRDDSTGGHIKRTSHVVRILMDEIMKDNVMKIDRHFYEYVIKAAPMHDLGKIAVDDVILRKPGRFTEEEYEIMKSHAAKGAQIVKTILQGIENPDFVRIAENVAHYHHERYDGSGYPMHLKGVNIPVEARIMAIADVYDALVSKRCYKEKMSFDDAFRIIEDGMGKDFDPRFNPYFVRCRRRLEEYYLRFEG